jgi:hypothetical protein
MTELGANGVPLFTQAELDAWLFAQGIERTNVGRLVIDVDPTGWFIGPEITVTVYKINAMGRKYTDPDTHEAVTETFIYRMHRGWKPKAEDVA